MIISSLHDFISKLTWRSGTAVAIDDEFSISTLLLGDKKDVIPLITRKSLFNCNCLFFFSLKQYLLWYACDIKYFWRYAGPRFSSVL